MKEVRKRVCISTDDVPAHEGLTYWQDVSVDTVVGVTCHPFADSFQASQICVDLGDLRLIEIKGVKHMVERSAAMVRKHSKRSLFVTLVVDGAGFLYQGDECIVLQPGDVALYNANTSYVFGWPCATRHITFDIPDENAELCSGAWNRRGPAKIDGSVGLGKFLSRKLHDCAYLTLAGEDPAVPELARAIQQSVDLCLRELRGGPSLPPSSGAALLRAQAYIVEHLANPQLNREMVSAAMRLSTRQLHRLFEANGTSIRRWILSQRLSECGRALKDPTLQGVSIAEICYRWGFSDTAHFSRAFRRAYGAAPRDYRERYRNGES